MTVCIAAVCNIGPDRPAYVVAASDRMITIGDIEYEPDQTKAVELGTKTIGLLAGDMQVHAAIIPKTMDALKELVSGRDPPRLTVEEIAEAYAKQFAYYRRTLAEREILVPRGMDFERFARLQATLPHYQVKELDARIATHVLDASAIIAGLDHTGASIYVIRDPGVAESFNTPFFACIGTGRDIAATQFMVAKYEKRWRLADALWLTFSAKARAEVAGGVGPKTDLIAIGPEGFIYAGEERKDELYALFRSVVARENAAQREAVETLEAYIRPRPDEAQAQSQDQHVSVPAGQDQPPKETMLHDPPISSSSKKPSRARRREPPSS